MESNTKYNDYYHRLWDWIEQKPMGSYEIVKFVNPKNMDWFTELIKHWIRVNEFIIFDFYLEFSDDYKFLNKKPAHNAVFETLLLQPQLNK